MENQEPAKTDWRQHLHSLPSGEKPLPKIPGFLAWIFLIPLLFVFGGITTLVYGGFLGLAFGVGPEDGGSVIYILFGLAANLAAGLIIVFTAKRRGYSSTACRAVFYAFTLPVVLIIFQLLFIDGCSQNPDEKPKMSDLAGTWIPAYSTSVSSTQFLRLNADHTFYATNFPSQSMTGTGHATNLSGGGRWELEQDYAAWLVDLSYTNLGYGDRWNVYKRKPPYLLTASLVDAENNGIRAHRVEDFSR